MTSLADVNVPLPLPVVFGGTGSTTGPVLPTTLPAGTALSSWATAGRPAGAVGIVGYNTTLTRFDAYVGTAYRQLLTTIAGTEALSAHTADGAVAGGNTRGANAVDLQTLRSSAGLVASGLYSVIGGGRENQGGGQSAVVAGGQFNYATGTNSAVAGGSGSQATGVSSWVPGGELAFTRGHYGRGAWGSGQFSVMGDAQAGEFVLRRVTTDATATRLTADNAAPGAANTLNLPNTGTYRMKLLVVAQQTAGTSGTAGDCASWEVNVLVKRGAAAANTAFVDGTITSRTPAIAFVVAGTAYEPGLRDAAAAGWRLTLAADTTNGGLAVTGTGELNKTIRWVARVLSVEATA